VWLTVLLHTLNKCHTVTVDFCHGHRVTGSLAVWSCIISNGKGGREGCTGEEGKGKRGEGEGRGSCGKDGISEL